MRCRISRRGFFLPDRRGYIISVHSGTLEVWVHDEKGLPKVRLFSSRPLDRMEKPMIPWELIESAAVPGDGGEIRLYRRGREFSIRVEGRELMNSSAHASEDALAELACARVCQRPGLTVLIGGLGMGYTLAAALRLLGAEGRLVVAELVPAVVAWNCGPLGGLAGHPVRDSRVEIRQGDVAEILQTEQGVYDVILLDVDNGPEGLSRKANDWLYSGPGLQAAFSALRPGGVLAVWSAGPDRTFTRRLRAAGFTVEIVPVRSRGRRKGGHHTIWLAGRTTEGSGGDDSPAGETRRA